MSRKTMIAAALLAACLSAPAFAQETDHSGHTMMNDMGMNDVDTTDTGRPKGDTGPSSTAFSKANARMHENMAMEYTGNADVDFVRGMIAHHQGAIDMAKVELEYGKDAEIRKLAENVISAQTGEIGMMKEWLAKNGR